MIKFEHVSKTYPNGVKGLQDINLEFKMVSSLVLLACLEQVSQHLFAQLIG